MRHLLLWGILVSSSHWTNQIDMRQINKRTLANSLHMYTWRCRKNETGGQI